VTKTAVVTDDPALIAVEIGWMKNAGCRVIVTTGGLSVDSDVMTFAGIRRSGVEIVFYGTPVLTGAMFVYARIGKAVRPPHPACSIYKSESWLRKTSPPA
jgi:molybdopterin biosynthesis enzyme